MPLAGNSVASYKVLYGMLSDEPQVWAPRLPVATKLPQQL